AGYRYPASEIAANGAGVFAQLCGDLCAAKPFSAEVLGVFGVLLGTLFACCCCCCWALGACGALCRCVGESTATAHRQQSLALPNPWTHPGQVHVVLSPTG